MQRIALFFISLLLATPSFASDITLDNLSENDVKRISQEFAANFVHTIVAPASSYGRIFGFELGVIGGVSESPEIDRISKTFDPTVTVDRIPHAGGIFAFSVPFGITGELSMIPQIDGDDLSLKNTSYALKWTFTDLFKKFPMDAAVRVHSGKSTLSYSDQIDGVNAKTTWESTSTGINIEASKKLLFFEPYIGLGYVSAETDIGVSASTNVSIFTFSSSQSYTSKNSGSHLFGGFNLNLFILKIGAEASRVLDVNRYTAKVSFYF